MRVIAGEKRGTILVSPPSKDIRPTYDMVREAVFGKLQFIVPGKRVLDLFAGSGAMGIEALSRGAAFAVFVDKSEAAISTVRANLQKTGFAEKSAIYKNAYEIALKMFHFGNKFDIVIIDPPYEAGLYEKALIALDESGMLNPGAILILESGEPLELFPERYTQTQAKKYGKTYVTYLEYTE
jgi:16S rRNA (guanine966-N2)-methyltransferase